MIRYIEDKYTQQTRACVNHRFQMKKEGIYFAHQPIYGYRTPFADTSNIARYMVTYSILKAISRYQFNNFIDIGGAEGYTANLVKELFRAEVVSTDLSENACKMAKKIFEINAIACDIHHLPFSNEQFQIVLCSETIEHVTDYKKAIEELLRITFGVLIITVPHENPKIVAENIRNNVPHGHIHYFHTKSLDYLKDEGYQLYYEKTLSPLLIIPRVIAEGFKKNKKSWYYQLYNFFTPILKKIFGLKTANWLVEMDAFFTKQFGLYRGITFIIEKKGTLRKKVEKSIQAKDFTSISVKEYRIDE